MADENQWFVVTVTQRTRATSVSEEGAATETVVDSRVYEQAVHGLDLPDLISHINRKRRVRRPKAGKGGAE